MSPATGQPPIDTGELRAVLVGPDQPWRRIDVVSETGSTNADLLARAAAGEDIDGAVLVAEHQTAGRGRHGREWLTPPGTQVALSVGIAAGDVPPEAWGWLPLAAGVAIADALHTVTDLEVRLKWPNDVVSGGAHPGKLAGILTEVAASQATIVVGLGLNVTLTSDDIEPEMGATSLTMLGSSAVDRNVLAVSILRKLGSRLGRWRCAKGADDGLIADYRRRSATLNSRVRVSLPGGREVVGQAVDIDPLGRLRVDSGSGVETLSAGDVTQLRPGPGLS